MRLKHCLYFCARIIIVDIIAIAEANASFMYYDVLHIVSPTLIYIASNDLHDYQSNFGLL